MATEVRIDEASSDDESYLGTHRGVYMGYLQSWTNQVMEGSPVGGTSGKRRAPRNIEQEGLAGEGPEKSPLSIHAVLAAFIWATSFTGTGLAAAVTLVRWTSPITDEFWWWIVVALMILCVLWWVYSVFIAFRDFGILSGKNWRIVACSDKKFSGLHYGLFCVTFFLVVWGTIAYYVVEFTEKDYPRPFNSDQEHEHDLLMVGVLLGSVVTTYSFWSTAFGAIRDAACAYFCFNCYDL